MGDCRVKSQQFSANRRCQKLIWREEGVPLGVRVRHPARTWRTKGAAVVRSGSKHGPASEPEIPKVDKFTFKNAQKSVGGGDENASPPHRVCASRPFFKMLIPAHPCAPFPFTQMPRTHHSEAQFHKKYFRSPQIAETDERVSPPPSWAAQPLIRTARARRDRARAASSARGFR